MESLELVVEQQRVFFATDRTKDIAFRKRQLRALKGAIMRNEKQISEALHADLGKAQYEAYVGEISLCLQEIDFSLKNLDSWAKPKRVPTPILHKPSSSYLYPEPYGNALIMAPWNYPFQLNIAPLVGAIAAGNTAVIKPSELAPHTSSVLADIIKKTFDPSYIAVVEGDAEVAQALLAEKFDYIFYTGGPRVGRIVAEAAAKNLTPVTLELGGKSPCIVDSDINIKYTARRIVWGKFFNAGQTCTAPDYLLVNATIKGKLVIEMLRTIEKFYGDKPDESPDFACIINRQHFDRLSGLLSEGTIISGGESDASSLYIEPTLIETSLDSRLMEEEIFGPILPIITYRDLDEAIAIINERPKPLALYLFTNDEEKQERVLKKTSSGGVCINDTLIHGSTSTLPFGGVGESGMGKYHGKASFDTFTHYKSVMKGSFLFDNELRYPPYKESLLNLSKKVLKYFG